MRVLMIVAAILIVVFLIAVYLVWPPSVAAGAEHFARLDRDGCVSLAQVRLDAAMLKARHGARLFIDDVSGFEAADLAARYNRLRMSGKPMPERPDLIVVYMTPTAMFMVPIVAGRACDFFVIKPPVATSTRRRQ